MITNHNTVQLSFTMAAIVETILDLYFQLSELKTQLIMTNVKDRNKKDFFCILIYVIIPFGSNL